MYNILVIKLFKRYYWNIFYYIILAIRYEEIGVRDKELKYDRLENINFKRYV